MNPQYWTFLRVDLLILYRARFHLWGLASAVAVGITLRILERHGVTGIPFATVIGLLIGVSACVFGGVWVRREVEQGSLRLLSTTPALSSLFLASKTSALCGLGFVQAGVVLITGGVCGPHDLLLFILGILGIAALGGMLGIVLGTYTRLRSYALSAGVFVLFGALSRSAAAALTWRGELLPMPPFACVALIEGSLFSISTPTLIWSFGLTCLSNLGLFVLCQSRLEGLAR